MLLVTMPKKSSKSQFLYFSNIFFLYTLSEIFIQSSYLGPTIMHGNNRVVIVNDKKKQQPLENATFANFINFSWPLPLSGA